MQLAAERIERGHPVWDRLLDWPGDHSPSAENAPLRFAGALHALRLKCLALEDVYPPNVVNDNSLWTATESAVRCHPEFILRWLDSPPQTNEVRRAAVILPALALLHQAYARPIELLELGTSAGLNLRADHFKLVLPNTILGNKESSVVVQPDWTGAEPPAVLPRIVRRAGVDLSPLNPHSEDDTHRLLSYIWADQPERLDRTRAALEISRRVPAEISKGDAGIWLENQLNTRKPDRLRVVLHTIARQYFSEQTSDRVDRALNNAEGPIALVSMEPDGGSGARVSVTANGIGLEHSARAGFHGQWVNWLS